MDKTELKRVLLQQFIPMDDAVRKKLDYLQSDDVFTDSPYAISEDMLTENEPTDSLMDAFNSVGVTTKPQPSVVQPQTASRPQPTTNSYNHPAASAQTPEAPIASVKQNMAARIAALRGISMPGDYLRRKN